MFSVYQGFSETGRPGFQTVKLDEANVGANVIYSPVLIKFSLLGSVYPKGKFNVVTLIIQGSLVEGDAVGRKNLQ